MIFHVQCYARYRNNGMNNRQNLTSYGCFRLGSLDLDFKNPNSSQTKKAKKFLLFEKFKSRIQTPWVRNYGLIIFEKVSIRSKNYFSFRRKSL